MHPPIPAVPDVLRLRGLLRAVRDLPLRPDDGDLHPVVPGAERRHDVPDERRLAGLVRCAFSQSASATSPGSFTRSIGLAAIVAIVTVRALGPRRAWFPAAAFAARLSPSTWRSPA